VRTGPRGSAGRLGGMRRVADAVSGGGAGGADGAARRGLGGEPERREEPPHRVGVGHRAQDPAAERDHGAGRE
jgi:hypothetical protein